MKKLLYKSKNKIWEIIELDNGNILIENLKDGYRDILSPKYDNINDLKQSWLVPEYIKKELIKIQKQKKILRPKKSIYKINSNHVLPRRPHIFYKP